jgi:hypothetical protein
MFGMTLRIVIIPSFAPEAASASRRARIDFIPN